MKYVRECGVLAFAVVLVLASALVAAADPATVNAHVVDETNTIRFGVNPGKVSVSNFPATQAVSGTVSVGNFPATQPVSGAVNVNNFPASQAVTGNVGVSGTVGVSSLPPVSVSNFPSTQTVSGTVNVGNFPATQPVSGSVGISGTPNVNVVNFPPASPSPVVPAKASDILTLQADGTPCGSDPHFAGAAVNQVTAADGTFQPFSIPVGQVFIVTGFDINAYGAAANQDVDIVFDRQGGASENSIVNMDVMADVNGIATLTRTLSPGAVVKPGATLCVRAGRLGGLPAFPSPVQVYGFFAPDA